MRQPPYKLPPRFHEITERVREKRSERGALYRRLRELDGEMRELLAEQHKIRESMVKPTATVVNEG
jgi:hypothetical protein